MQQHKPNQVQRIFNTIRFFVELLASKVFWMACGVGFFFTWLISNKLEKTALDTGLIGLVNAISWMLITWGSYKLYTYTANKQPEPAPHVSAPPQPRQLYPPMPRRQGSSGTTHGTAAWEINDKIDTLFNNGNTTFIEGEGYYIGAGYNITPLMHAVCIAGSGQGKGVSLILPNLLKQPTASWFVLDPKGENAFITAKWQQDAGQKVIILDPWGEQERQGARHGIAASGFNPLSFIKDKDNSNENEIPENCDVIADMLVPDASNSKDQYWNSRAKALIKTYILHLITDRPEAEHHLGTLYRWLRLPTRDRRRLWFEMEENLACDELVKSGIGEFVGLSDDTGPLPSIISTAQDSTKFLESPAVRASLEKNEFNPYELTNGNTTVYVCLPERFLSTHHRWMRLVVGVCLKACNYKPGKRVNFLLDEFAILGKMPDVQRAFAYARGQNVSMWIFVQSLTQLIEIYGEHEANSFLSNARLRQFFGINDLSTQRYVSEYLGEYTLELETKSTSTTTSTSTGTSHGTSTGTSENTGGGSSSSNNGGSKSTSYGSGTSSGKSEGTSQSTSTSTATSRNKQVLGRRLLTIEEVGKYPEIITFIDGHKFSISKLPYWDSFYKAYEEGRFIYYPLNEVYWHEFIDCVRSPERDTFFDLSTVFRPRAQQKEQPS